MTSEQISALAGVVLSLAFSYVPGLSDWFGELRSEYKRLLMAGLMLVVAAAAYGLTCAGWLETAIVCDEAGVMALVWAYIAALVANQATYTLTRR